MQFGVFGAQHGRKVRTTPHYYLVDAKTGTSGLTLDQQIQQVLVVSKDLHCPSFPRLAQATLDL